MNNTEWQPIETAPKDGTEILLYLGSEWEGIMVGHFGPLDELNHGTFDYEPILCWQSGLEKSNPTHWTPLPKPPKQ